MVTVFRTVGSYTGAQPTQMPKNAKSMWQYAERGGWQNFDDIPNLQVTNAYNQDRASFTMTHHYVGFTSSKYQATIYTVYFASLTQRSHDANKRERAVRQVAFCVGDFRPPIVSLTAT